MVIRVATTCHEAGYREYGHRLLESIPNWPAECSFRWYVEGEYVPPHDRITRHPLASIAALGELKRTYARYTPPNYLFDVVRFAHKVYAAYDAFRDFDGIGVWCDADAVMHAPMPSGWIESKIGDAYMAMFKRKGMYTETGLWIVNCAHQHHKPFMDTWTRWYETRAFQGLANWTDCETLDATVRKFEKARLITTVSLSGEHESDTHPMAKAEISRYLDHCKGPRKATGRSPENLNRSAR